MNIDNGINFLKHLSFWDKKPDDECIKLASNEYGVDAREALLNILERDFCTTINNYVVESLMKKQNEIKKI